MAKKKSGGINLSQVVRDYLTNEDPRATPKEIVEVLAKRGIHVTTGLASNVKYSNRDAPWHTSKKAAAPAATSSHTTNNHSTASSSTRTATAPARTSAREVLTGEDLLEAKKLADQLGGIDKVREALGILEQLR